MTDKNKTLIALVQDCSGSMNLIKAATEEALNSFVGTQREQPGECVMTYVQFDTNTRTVFENLPIKSVGKMAITPGGGTALLDAVAGTINKVGWYLASLPEHERPGSVIFAINTDGEENSSRRYGYAQVTDMIAHQRDKYGWLFLFLGADQDAIANASRMGIAQDFALSYDSRNVGQTMTAMTTNTSNYRAANARGATHDAAVASAAFTKEQRDEAAEDQS